MKLYPLSLTDKISINAESISTKLRLNTLTKSVDKDIDALIIVGDGGLEGKVLSILAYHLNGAKILAFVKPPGKTGLGVIEYIPMYLDKNSKISNFTILMDQERENANDLVKNVESKIIEKGISLETITGEGRFRIYDCTRGNRGFRLALIINGLDEIQTETHSVEDHLVKAARLFNPSVDVSGFRDSKEAWNFFKKEELKTFQRLKDESNIETFFPQQVRALRELLQGS